MKLMFDCQDVDGSRWIIRGYKSVIKTLCRLDRQNMSEDNTIKVQHCQELSKLSRQKSATELCSERPTITTYLLTVTCILFLLQNKSRVRLRVRVLSAEPRDYLRYGRPGGTRGEKWQACDVLCPPDFICCLLFPRYALKAGKWIWYLLTSKLWEAFQWLGNQRPPPAHTHACIFHLLFQDVWSLWPSWILLWAGSVQSVTGTLIIGSSSERRLPDAARSERGVLWSRSYTCVNVSVNMLHICGPSSAAVFRFFITAFLLQNQSKAENK